MKNKTSNGVIDALLYVFVFVMVQLLITYLVCMWRQAM